MKIINEIQIRKFRSIKSITRDLDVTDLNIFVGQNDNGKSNILRALNLFFNNQTDVGQDFRFEDDYCYHATSGTGSRREIRIDLIIQPPASRFKNAQKIRWTKQWKRDGSVVERKEYVATSKEVPLKEPVSKWLEKLKYRYVPAIKGRDYFNTLMGELHDVLNEAHTKLMDSQGKGFISGIQKVTAGITKELNTQIGIPSTIQVPSDFKQLFSNLDFGSTVDGNTYHLKQRGDGIKIRHIPVILKYMAEQEKNISIPGYVKPDTIWGFEEPENNLEMRFAFELAQTLQSYSKDIQILVTTHSPAFYALHTNKSVGISKFYVEKTKDLCTAIAKIDAIDHDDLHEKMGLLPLITPYLEDVYKGQVRIEQLEKEILEKTKSAKCCVITEDQNNDYLRVLLEANGFPMKDTEVVSYNGKDQIKGALILGKYLKNKHSDMVILVHRDRDYLSDTEVNNLANSFKKNDIHFFCTTGVDAESHFIAREHLTALLPDLDPLVIDAAVTNATQSAEEESVGRYINHTLQGERPHNNDYAGHIQKIQRSYASDVKRYRYSKKVLGLLKSTLQRITGSNVRLDVPTIGLVNNELQAVATLIP